MIEPLLDRVLVEVVKKDERTESGIILPDTINDTNLPKQTEVIAVGKDCEVVKEGETILFSKFSGVEVEYKKRDLVVIQEKEILARVNNG